MTPPEGGCPFPPEACTILESMGDAFYALDADWRVVYANQRALDFWSRAATLIVGETIWTCLPQLRGTFNEQVLRRVRREQRTESFEAPSPVTGVWVNVTVCPWTDGVVVYWRDIAKRKQTEQALQASEEHLRLAQEAGGIGAWDWDFGTGQMHWSAQMYRLLGLEPKAGENLPQRLFGALHPQDLEKAQSALAEFSKRLGPLRVELRVQHPNGDTRWLVFLGKVEPDQAGHPAHMLGIVIDGTTRRMTEEAIRTDAERLRLALRAGGLAAWELDLERNIRIWSPEAAAMIGMRAHSMPRSEWARMIHQDDINRVRANLTAAIGGSGEYAEEYRVIRADDGEMRWTAVQGSVLRDVDGRPSRVVGIVQDVTDRKVAEERLHRANEELEARVRLEVAAREAAQARAAHAERMQALGQLAGGIAHDFNNVLQAVAGGANLIARRPKDPDAVLRFARIIIDAAERGSSITRRLLTFAHRGDLRAEAIDLSALLDGLREILTHTLGPAIHIEVGCAPRLPAVLADRGQLETVLVNLATNARDAMPDGGPLTFSAASEIVLQGAAHAAALEPGAYVVLSAADCGIGMDRETLARASEPFFTTKKKGEGTGLGLAMARGFAEQSGGGLLIESEQDVGTTVKLFLPQAAEPVTDRPIPIEEASGAAIARLVLADDDALVRETLGAELEGAGYAVHAVPGGEEALTWINNHEVDCLIADLSMPGLDGLTLIQRAQRRRPRLPAILLTGFAGDSAALAVSGAVSGSFSLLRKPIELAQLCDRITLLLEKTHA